MTLTIASTRDNLQQIIAGPDRRDKGKQIYENSSWLNLSISVPSICEDLYEYVNALESNIVDTMYR